MALQAFHRTAAFSNEFHFNFSWFRPLDSHWSIFCSTDDSVRLTLRDLYSYRQRKYFKYANEMITPADWSCTIIEQTQTRIVNIYYLKARPPSVGAASVEGSYSVKFYSGSRGWTHSTGDRLSWNVNQNFACFCSDQGWNRNRRRSMSCCFLCCFWQRIFAQDRIA